MSPDAKRAIEKQQEMEEQLRELLGNAAVEALKSKPGLQGLCKDCANREVCRKRKDGTIILSCASHRAGPAISPKTFKTIDEVLAFALEREERLFNFFEDLAKTATQPATKKAFKDFAKRAAKHYKEVKKIQKNGKVLAAAKNVPTLRITDYVTRDVQPDENLDTREAFLVALKAVGATQKLYADLANRTEDPRVQELFAALAQAKAELKLELETEYDEHFLAQG